MLEPLPAPPGSPAPAPATVVPAAPAAPLSWRDTARVVWPPFVITRIVALIAGLLGTALWPTHEASDTNDPLGLTRGFGELGDRLLAPFAHWDAVWFLDIANNGYPTDYAPRTAFFPLYPAILRVGDALFQSPLLFGLLVSTVCAFVGTMIVHRLAELELGRPAARMTVWVLLVFPGSLWLTAVYSEGLFLLLSAACLYFAREGRWGLVAVVGVLAATTRSAGIVLVVPVLVFAWQQRHALLARAGAARGLVPATAGGTVGVGGSASPTGPSRPTPTPTGRPVRLIDRLPIPARAALGPLLAAAAVVGGLVLFVVALRLNGFGWRATFDQQEEWGRRSVGPLDGIVRAVDHGVDGARQVVDAAGISLARAMQADWMDPLLLVFLVVGLVALVGAARRLPPAYAAYAGCALLMPLSAPGVVDGTAPLMSLPRFLGVLFPLAMWAGWWLSRGPRRRTRQLALGATGLLLLMLVSELTARWIFFA